MVKLETITMMNKLKSRIISSARFFSGAKIKIADKYCAKTMMAIL